MKIIVNNEQLDLLIFAVEELIYKTTYAYNDPRRKILEQLVAYLYEPK